MLKRRRVFWQTMPLQILLVLALLLLVAIDGSRRFHRLALEHLTGVLEDDAQLASGLAADAVLAGDRKKVDALCKTFGRSMSKRVTVIGSDGEVLGDSEKDPASMENHADRPEVREALSGRPGVMQRYSMTLDKRMMYVAVPLESNGRVIGVARVSESLDDVNAFVHTARFRIGLMPLIAGFFLALVAAAFAYRLKQSVTRFRDALASIEQGDYRRRLYDVPIPVLDPVAYGLNHAAEAVQRRMTGVMRERDELEAVLADMTEGVMVVDGTDRIQKFNLSAERLFGQAFEAVKGRPVYEVIRNGDLLRFIEKTQASSEPIEEDIVLHEAKDIFLQAHGTVLRGSEDRIQGVLLVFSDVTRLRRLENLRKEFVANVSHELKTPVTSIQGFVETLKDGANQNPKEAERFLDIILKHTRRLNAMIDDLLNLSRIEQQTEKREIVLERNSVRDVIEEAVSICQAKADAKTITLQIECGKDLTAMMRPDLLVQAVSNLIDNAVKYTGEAGKVTVRAARREDGIHIEVEDRGAGIPKEHLPRLFERFYRVDPSRSRDMGGTGLGLAIVKHVAQAHGGRAEASSEEGKGSVFSIVLPI
jgi:two-component system, OmpR family, phosphate regulon sensor histidine kinase PhoR